VSQLCGEDLGREHPPLTCRRRPGHNTVCSPNRDRGSEAFADAWAEYFDQHPDIAASWSHQNGRWPPGHGASGGC
jgi:hypothetical protein